MAPKKTTVKKVSDASRPVVKGRKPIDPNETKEQKLSRLATARVTKTCKQISLIGNLATYKPTDDDIDKIMLALGESCSRVDARLRGTRRESYVFTLNP